MNIKMLLGTSQPDPFHGFGNQALSSLGSWFKLDHHASRFGTASFEYRVLRVIWFSFPSGLPTALPISFIDFSAVGRQFAIV